MVVSVYGYTELTELGDVFQFAGFFPFDEVQYNTFEQSIERLALNDTGVRLVPTSNPGNPLLLEWHHSYRHSSPFSIRQRHADWILGQFPRSYAFAHRFLPALGSSAHGDLQPTFAIGVRPTSDHHDPRCRLSMPHYRQR